MFRRVTAGTALLLLVIVMMGCGSQTPAPRASGDSPSTVVTLQPVADTWLNQASPDTNYGSGVNLYCGVWGQEAQWVRRDLIRFSLSSIPPGGTITSGKLGLYLLSFTGTADRVQVFRVPKAWGEMTATWNNNSSNYVLPFITVKSVNAANMGAYVWFDITSLVQAWYSGKDPNRGVLVRGLEMKSLAGAEVFGAGEIKDPTKRPLLKVQYSAP